MRGRPRSVYITMHIPTTRPLAHLRRLTSDRRILMPRWAICTFIASELFLKAFLRAHGHSVRELERTFGHNIQRMRERAVELGFELMDEDLEVLSFMEQTPVVIDSRYIRTGYFERPTNEALERTAISLRETTGELIRRTTGVNVRD